MFTYRTDSPEDTYALGLRLGERLGPGMVLLLDGDLGAGKTCLAGGILKALGVEELVTSPTYTLVNEYEGRVRVAHFDLYRLNDPDELFDIGFEEYLDGQRVVLIEWPERAGGFLPPHFLTVHLSGRGNEREITLEPVGDEYVELDKEMKNVVSAGN